MPSIENWRKNRLKLARARVEAALTEEERAEGGRDVHGALECVAGAEERSRRGNSVHC